MPQATPIALDLVFGRVGVVAASVPAPPLPVPTPDGDRVLLEEVFATGSRGVITLRSVDRTGDFSFDQDAAAVDELAMQEALGALTGNVGTQAVDRMAVLYAPFYQDRPGVFGMMFDTQFRALPTSVGHRPREGCAVFLDAIDAAFNGEERANQVAFTTVHELGHCFNLLHVSAHRCFLNTSSNQAQPPADAYRFLENQRDWLEACATDDLVRPGRSDFRDFGGSSHDAPGTRARAVRPGGGWSLEINLSPPTFGKCAPVELNLSLRLTPSAARAREIPDELHPGYGRLVIWMEEPTGEVRRYRPTIRFCQNRAVIKVDPGRSHDWDVPIFGRAGGYTFREYGKYRVWATVDLSPKVRLRSNDCVGTYRDEKPRTKAARTEVEEQQRFLRRGARTFFYRSGKLLPVELEALERLAERHSSTWYAAEAHYALGRTLDAHLRYCGKARSLALRDRALRHLETAGSSRMLNRLRRQKAICYFKNLSER